MAGRRSVLDLGFIETAEEGLAAVLPGKYGNRKRIAPEISKLPLPRV
jgi:hypothetical protein